MSNAPEIRVGQYWLPVDPRFPDAPAVEVIAIGKPYVRYVGSAEQRDVTIRNTATGRQTKARSDRFNGRRGGYRLAKDAP